MPVLRCKSVLSSIVVPLLIRLTVEVQRDRAQADMCAFWTRNHDSFTFLVLGAQSGINRAHFGYVKHWREHAEGFIENGRNVGEPDNIRVGLPDTNILIRRAREISRLDVPGAAPWVPSRGPLRVPSAVPPGAVQAQRRQRRERD